MTDEMNKGASNFVQDLGDAIKKNPISAALIGMGAVWLLSGRGGQTIGAAREAWAGSASLVRSGGESLKEGLNSTAESLRDQGSKTLDRLSEAGGTIAQTASGYAGAAPEFADNLLGDMRENLSELFRTQPLALGAVGLAIGAAVAASLPRSEIEETYFSESSNFVKQKASEIAGEQTRRAVEAGKKVVDAVADEARQQGLSIDGVKATAREFTEKVSRVADAAKNPPSDTTGNVSPGNMPGQTNLE
jgi:hypothetical protein